MKRFCCDCSQDVGFPGLFDVLSSRPVLNKVRFTFVRYTISSSDYRLFSVKFNLILNYLVSFSISGKL